VLTTSLPYVLGFLPAAVIALVVVRPFSGKAARLLLAALSLMFYLFSASPGAFVQLFASTGVNYWASRRISSTTDPGQKARIFWLALLANLVYLGTYKLSLNFGLSTMPLGISYFTIIQIMVLVDAYQGAFKVPAWTDYWSFVAFFPQITAGPISPQFSTLSQFVKLPASKTDWDKVCIGLVVFVIGLFKKVVVADTLGAFVDSGYSHIPTLGLAEAWFATTAYFLQFFLDFSGCADMAVGAGLMLGIRLPYNFEMPYRCTNIAKFWQEWHMSLTSFITNYVYSPLLKSWGRFSFARTMTITCLSMVICGMWHGISASYLLWGFYHGSGLVLYQCWKKAKIQELPPFLAWLLTMGFVFFSYLLVRARNLTEVLGMARALLGANLETNRFYQSAGFDKLDWLLGLGALGVGIYLSFFFPSTRLVVARFRPKGSYLLLSILMFVISCALLNSSRETNFIYANF